MMKRTELTMDCMNYVNGGKDVQVNNKTVPYANLRKAPGLSTEVEMKLDNGDWVGTTGKTEKKDGYT